MESITYLKNIKISPKKLRFFIPTIKKQRPMQVLQQLQYSPTRPGQLLYQGIKSAIHNAKNALNIDDSLLQFKTLTVEEGQKIKRYKAGGRGTPKPIIRRFSHIKIILIGQSISDKKTNVDKIKTKEVIASKENASDITVKDTTKKIESKEQPKVTPKKVKTKSIDSKKTVKKLKTAK